MNPIYSIYEGNNAALVKEVSDFYISDGQYVADVTWGKGVFWKMVDTSRFYLFPSDIITLKDVGFDYDFCHLPYPDGVFHHVVLDPPYVHNPGRLIVDANYQNANTTKGFYHIDIMGLYKKGMAEALRCLKEGGRVWVKCQDQIESGYQRWSHVEIHDMAIELGLFGKDLFVLKQRGRPHIQHKRQLHARKAHSYLWIFQKPTAKEIRELQRYEVFK